MSERTNRSAHADTDGQIAAPQLVADVGNLGRLAREKELIRWNL